MEYQKAISLLEISLLQINHLNLRQNWVEINDESRGTYDEDNQIRFKTSMLRSSLCDYSDAYILARGTTTVGNTGAQGAAKNIDKKIIFKN